MHSSLAVRLTPQPISLHLMNNSDAENIRIDAAIKRFVDTFRARLYQSSIQVHRVETVDPILFLEGKKELLDKIQKVITGPEYDFLVESALYPEDIYAQLMAWTRGSDHICHAA